MFCQQGLKSDGVRVFVKVRVGVLLLWRRISLCLLVRQEGYQEKKETQWARKRIAIQIFSLVKLATACNRWRGSASATCEPHLNLRWNGISKGNYLWLIRSLRNFLLVYRTWKEYSWNATALNSSWVYLNYTFSETLIKKWELPRASNCKTVLSLFTLLEIMLLYIKAAGEITILILAGSTEMKTTISLCYTIYSSNEEICAPLCCKAEHAIIFT